MCVSRPMKFYKTSSFSDVCSRTVTHLSIYVTAAAERPKRCLHIVPIKATFKGLSSLIKMLLLSLFFFFPATVFIHLSSLSVQPSKAGHLIHTGFYVTDGVSLRNDVMLRILEDRLRNSRCECINCLCERLLLFVPAFCATNDILFTKCSPGYK